MTAFMQMGHHTENLIGEKGLKGFGGIILSPVDRRPNQMADDVKKYRDKGEFEILFDSQLYAPRVERRCLPEYSYFPDDADTADLSSTEWWEDTVRSLSDTATYLGVDSLASPIMIPKIWSDEYLSISMQVADHTAKTVPSINVYATCMVRMSELTDRDRRLQLASIFSQPEVYGYYVIFYSETEPRRELRDSEELASSLNFIRLLESTGRPVLVGYSSSDMLLYKAAGATHCATGKFFNLRRFTKSRFEEPPSAGGGQLPYWFEESLLAFLRDADLQRIRRRLPDLIMQGGSNNPWSQRILEKMDEGSGAAWLADSWRQYLAWFSEKEPVYGKMGMSDIELELAETEERWEQIADQKILMDERRNDGGWVRGWRQALTDLEYSEVE